MHVNRWLLLFLAASSLAAGDLGIFVSTGVSGPTRMYPNTFTLDALGNQAGQGLQLSSPYRPLGLEVDYGLVRSGAWRLDLSLGYDGIASKPDLYLNYSQFPKVSTTQGTVQLTSINPGIGLTYITTGAGEYGFALEPRNYRATYNISAYSPTGYYPAIPNPGSSVSFSQSALFVLLRASFSVQFDSLALVTRFGLGFSTKSAGDVTSFGPTDYDALNHDLLALALPRQEARVSVGVRF